MITGEDMGNPESIYIADENLKCYNYSGKV